MESKKAQQPITASEQKKTSVRDVIRVALIVVLSCVLVLSVCMFARSWLGGNDPSVQTSGSAAGSSVSRPTGTSQSTTITTAPPKPETDRVDLRFWEYTEPVWLIGQAARDFLQQENVPIAGDFLWHYFQTGDRLDVGLPVELGYSVFAMPEGCSVTDAVFELSESADFSTCRVFYAGEGENSVTVYGLYTGQQYHCRVTVTLSDGTEHVLTCGFRTAASPRILTIDGIVNVRDVGGWMTADGRAVRQGLLYRGSELDGAVEPGYKLTEAGKSQMLEQLGIRMDMDLRYEGENVLGDGVKYSSYTVLEYAGAFTEDGQEAIRRVFADLAEPENYPIYLHCTYGADRTGTVCYLLGALLGVSDGDLMRDYDLSALTHRYVSDGLMDAFVAQLATFEGDTTQEKVECFLLSTGVTAQQIERIRQIFLG